LRRRGIKATRPEIKLVEFNDIEIVFADTPLLLKLRVAIEKANESRLKAAQTQLEAEAYLLSELGFSDANTPRPLSYAARSSDVLSADRWDAQYFQPKYEYLLDQLNRTRDAHALGDILSINVRGRQPKYADGGLQVVNSRHVRKNRVVLDGQNRVARLTEGNPQIEPGDVLLNGTGVGTIGRAAPYTHQAVALPDNHVTILRAKSLDPIYLSAFLNSPIGQLQIERYIKGSSGQIELYPSDIAKIIVWRAPPNIQENVRSKIALAFELENSATVLLSRAKRAVEISIERDDAAAIQYLSGRDSI
jgi:type I restriction enzyme S subunit